MLSCFQVSGISNALKVVLVDSLFVLEKLSSSSPTVSISTLPEGTTSYFLVPIKAGY